MDVPQTTNQPLFKKSSSFGLSEEAGPRIKLRGEVAPSAGRIQVSTPKKASPKAEALWKVEDDDEIDEMTMKRLEAKIGILLLNIDVILFRNARSSWNSQGW